MPSSGLAIVLSGGISALFGVFVGSCVDCGEPEADGLLFPPAQATRPTTQYRQHTRAMALGHPRRRCAASILPNFFYPLIRLPMLTGTSLVLAPEQRHLSGQL